MDPEKTTAAATEGHSPDEATPTEEIKNPAGLLNALATLKAERQEMKAANEMAQAQLAELNAKLEAEAAERQKQAEVLEQLAKALGGDAGAMSTPTPSSDSQQSPSEAKALLERYKLDQALKAQQEQWKKQGEHAVRQQYEPQIQQVKEQYQQLEQKYQETLKRQKLATLFAEAGGLATEFEGFLRLAGDQFVYDPGADDIVEFRTVNGTPAFNDQAQVVTPKSALLAIRQGKANEWIPSANLARNAFIPWNQASGGATPIVRQGAQGRPVPVYASVSEAAAANPGMNSDQLSKALRNQEFIIER